MKTKINSLLPACVETNVGKFHVEHCMKLTMIDGKVCQALTETPSSASCTICRALLSEMNNLDKLANKVEIEENLQYGLSSLHAWIRFMEIIMQF